MFLSFVFYSSSCRCTGELNTLNKIFHKENLDLTEIGEAIEITTRSLSRKFLVDEEEFSVDTKFVAHFLDISRGGQIHFQDSTESLHLHIFHYAPLLHAIDFGADGTLQGCTVITQAYVLKVMESLQQQFPDLKIFNVEKLFSPISFSQTWQFFTEMVLYGFKFLLSIFLPMEGIFWMSVV